MREREGGIDKRTVVEWLKEKLGWDGSMEKVERDK